jgi:hypothetical protein
MVEQGGLQTGPVSRQGSFPRSLQCPANQVSRRPRMTDSWLKQLSRFLFQNPKQQELKISSRSAVSQAVNHLTDLINPADLEDPGLLR